MSSKGRDTGVLTTWNPERGFGFIARSGEDDLFVHITQMPPGLEPETGERVAFEVAPGRDGRMRAMHVEFPKRDDYVRPPAPTPPLLALVAVLAFVGIWAIVALVWNSVPIWMYPLYAGLSLITAAVYALDKAAARRQAHRVAETSLLVLGALGGWPGALAAQQVLRHKTLKISFRVRFWLSVLVNVVAFLLLSTPVVDLLVAWLS